MPVVRLNRRNQIVLPKAAREALGVKPGGRLLVRVEEGSVRLLPAPENWSEWMYGLGAEAWASLGGGEAFFREERSSWERQD